MYWPVKGKENTAQTVELAVKKTGKVSCLPTGSGF